MVELDNNQVDYIVPPESFTERVLIARSSDGYFTSSNAILSNLFYNQGSGLYEFFQSKNLLDRYKDHIVVVAIGKECKQVSEYGGSKTTGSTHPPLGTFHLTHVVPSIDYTPTASVILLFDGRDKETMVHEILHAIGLLHSFSSFSPYVYKPKKTDNIMDYSHQNNIPRIATWQWQWEIIREYIDNSRENADRRIAEEQQKAAKKKQEVVENARKVTEYQQKMAEIANEIQEENYSVIIDQIKKKMNEIKIHKLKPTKK